MFTFWTTKTNTVVLVTHFLTTWSWTYNQSSPDTFRSCTSSPPTTSDPSSWMFLHWSHQTREEPPLPPCNTQMPELCIFPPRLCPTTERKYSSLHKTKNIFNARSKRNRVRFYILLTVIVFVANSTPIVCRLLVENSFLVKRPTSWLFPTPESPTTTTLIK